MDNAESGYFTDEEEFEEAFERFKWHMKWGFPQQPPDSYMIFWAMEAIRREEIEKNKKASGRIGLWLN